MGEMWDYDLLRCLPPLSYRGLRLRQWLAYLLENRPIRPQSSELRAPRAFFSEFALAV